MPTDANPPNYRQLRQWVVERLRVDILEGRLKPGDWLRQERLAREQGVSQTPVREALKQLAAEGLVEHVPYRGVRVVSLSVEDVEDLYSCREAIEGMAARYAAASISAAQVKELESLRIRMADCIVPSELKEYRDLNRQFHSIIFKASGRSFLVRTLAQLWAAFPTMLWSNIPRVAVASLPERDEPDIVEHAEIVAALAAHDGKRAEAAVQAHIRAAGASLVEAMRAVK